MIKKLGIVVSSVFGEAVLGLIAGLLLALASIIGYSLVCKSRFLVPDERVLDMVLWSFFLLGIALGAIHGGLAVRGTIRELLEQFKKK
jgi:hypothetical protein